MNWHRAPEAEFHLYGEAFWRAAKTLLQQNEALDGWPGASFDASVIVYLYRHALELFLKGILLGRGRELVDPPTAVSASHSLVKLLPDVRRIFAECGWDKKFGSGAVATFDDFAAIVEELDKADPKSFSFRYPVKTDLITGTLDDHFTFNVRQFALTMDEVLNALYDACYSLPDIANDQAEAAHEAWCEAMQDGEPPDCEPG